MLDRFVLPPDTLLIPVSESSAAQRAVPDAGPDDWLLTRPGTRLSSRIVGPDTAALLRQFQTPRSVIEALVAFAGERGIDPGRELEHAYPVLRELVATAILVPEGAPHAAPVTATLRPGRKVAGFRVGRSLHVKQDTETYQVWTPDGEPAVLKLASAGDEAYAAQLCHETDVIARLAGNPAPRLITRGSFQGRRYLVTAWCPGAPIHRAAAEIRTPDSNARTMGRLRDLCLSVLHAYARLHGKGTLHGDIHPHNVLVEQDGRVFLIDFGNARCLDKGPTRGAPLRGGVSIFYEPEVALAHLAGDAPPPATVLGEQYALGALLFGLLTGQDYLELPADREEAMERIANEPRRSFADCGAAPWPDVEAVLARALAKSPDDRYPSVVEFGKALGQAQPKHGHSKGRRTIRSAAGRLIQAVSARLAPGGEAARSGDPPRPAASVYYGAAGTALGLLRLAQARDSAHLLAMSQFWIMRAQTASLRAGAFRAPEFRLTARRLDAASPYHGVPGVHVVRALIAQAAGRSDQFTSACRDFLSTAAATAAVPGKLDLTLGAPGALIACTLLHDAQVSAPRHLDRGRKILSAIEATGDQMAQALWSALSGINPGDARTGGRLSGIAHGWSGLAYALMLWRQLRGMSPPEGLRESLERLVARSEPEGRGVVWPIRLTRGGGGATMASWCNGAPGQTHLWLLAHRVYRDTRYRALAERCAWNAWEAGHGTGSLCCGEAGRAFALAALWRETGEDPWLRRARELAERAATRITGRTDRPDSLFKGALGPALVLAELDRPEAAAFPLFERGR